MNPSSRPENHNFWCFSERQSKNTRNWKVKQIPGPCPVTKKAVEYEGDGDSNGSRAKRFWKRIKELEIRGKMKAILTPGLLRWARILKSQQVKYYNYYNYYLRIRVLETWGDLLSLNLQWNTISLRWCEKF